MEYFIAVSMCIGCNNVISYNPHHVPVLVTESGDREPICKGCYIRWNEIHRISKGLEPVSLHPQAYEPQEE
jgi:hypothetical protein